MTILDDGNVGIGEAAPDATLDVVGTFQLDNGADTDYVLTATDNLGNTAWTDPSTLDDHDWHKTSGDPGTDQGQADDIGDNIYTNGSVGIGTTDSVNKLHVHGGSSNTVYAHFTNDDTEADDTDGLSIGISSGGTGLIWLKENTDLRIGTNSSEAVRIESDGDIAMKQDNSIKMPNNLVYKEYRDLLEYDNDANSSLWFPLHDWTEWMNVEDGNTLLFNLTTKGRWTNRDGDYDYTVFHVYVQGTGSCSASFYTEAGGVENLDYYGYRLESYRDVLDIDCDGQMRFRAEVWTGGGGVDLIWALEIPYLLCKNINLEPQLDSKMELMINFNHRLYDRSNFVSICFQLKRL